jgi:hypothetical protein
VFVVENATGQPASVATDSGGSPGGLSVDIRHGTTRILHSDGTDIRGLSTGGTYDIGMFVATLGNDAIVGQLVAARAFTIPADAPGSQAKAGITTSSGEDAIVFDLRKNAASFGSVTFDPPTNTGTFSVASDTSFAVGDLLQVVSPAVGSPDSDALDTTLANVSITFKVEI